MCNKLIEINLKYMEKKITQMKEHDRENYKEKTSWKVHRPDGYTKHKPGKFVSKNKLMFRKLP